MNNNIECAFTATMTKEPELRQTKTGEDWLRASAAVTSGAGAIWISLMIFGEQVAGLKDRLAKGGKVYCEGRLDASAYVARDGEAKPSLTCFPWLVQPVGQIGKRRPRKPRQSQSPSECLAATGQPPLNDPIPDLAPGG